MAHHVNHRQRLHVLILAAAIAAAALPAMAGDHQRVDTSLPGIAASIQKAVAAGLPTAQAPVAARATATGASKAPTDLGSRSFFRTPAGVITLVAIGMGVGYAIYSTQNDRVRSPAR